MPRPLVVAVILVLPMQLRSGLHLQSMPLMHTNSCMRSQLPGGAGSFPDLLAVTALIFAGRHAPGSGDRI